MYISIKNMSHNEWLQKRREGIGGSDAPAILGISKYKTPLDVYLDKIGQSEITEETDEMWFGRQMEAIIATRFKEKTGLTVQNDNKMRFHNEAPFILADMDRVIGGSSQYSGTGALEIKTTNYYNMKNWLGEVDPMWYVQLQHYMMVAGYTWGAIAFLVDRKYHHVFFERNKNLHNQMLEIYSKFWDRVEKRTPPEPAEGEDIGKLYKSHVPEKITEADDSTHQIFEKLAEVRQTKKDLEEQEKNLKAQIKEVMKDSEALVYDDQPLVTWKEVKTNKFDTKQFKEDYPELYEQYVKENSFRKFLPKT